MNKETFKDATREQNSILAPMERSALRWFAERMPAPINSDHLSLLGLFAMLFAGIFYVASSRNLLFLHAVNACIFLNWFGDSLDGTLARYRNCQRPRYGFYVDHIIDTFGAAFLLGGLALSGLMNQLIAGGVLIVFFMLAINSYLAAYALRVFKISQGKFGPTEIRLVLMIGNLFLLRSTHTRIFGHRYLLFDVGGVVSMVIMLAILIFATIKNTHALYNLERLPTDKRDAPASNLQVTEIPA